MAAVTALLLLLALAATPSRAATPARSPPTAVFQLQGDVYPTGYATSSSLIKID
jgi:hypothetical protein